ncbi:MAG: TIGR00266 family protein [Thermomicrobiales bacterium]
MKTELLYRPSFAVARVELEAGEEIRSEAGAMLSKSANVQIQTSATGGLLKSLKRGVLGGESFFMNTFRSEGGPGEVLFAPSLPGDVVTVEIGGATSGSSLLVNSGSFVAAELGVNVDTKFRGGRGFFATSSFFMLLLSGQGQAILSAYGALHPVTLRAGERYTVDSGHVIAFDESMPHEVRRVGGLKSTLFSGEGFVIEIEGPGNLLLQTRSQQAFLSWLIPNLPSSRSSND